MITAWTLDAGSIGRKAPRPGYTRKAYCPPCSRILTQSNDLSHIHVLLVCKVMAKVREDQGITRFMDTCRYSLEGWGIV